jgi:hypothetical protein
MPWSRHERTVQLTRNRGSGALPGQRHQRGGAVPEHTHLDRLRHAASARSRFPVTADEVEVLRRYGHERARTHAHAPGRT